MQKKIIFVLFLFSLFTNVLLSYFIWNLTDKTDKLLNSHSATAETLLYYTDWGASISEYAALCQKTIYDISQNSFTSGEAIDSRVRELNELHNITMYDKEKVKKSIIKSDLVFESVEKYFED